MENIEGIKNFQHPLLLGSFRNWMRILRENSVDRPYVPRALSVSLVSFLTIPLRAYERIRYKRAVEATRIREAPVFILGHMRSGTTHLHYLMCQDPSLGYVSTFQALAPGLFFIGDRLLKPMFGKKMPSVRPMDNMAFSIDLPQEEEVAIANLTPYSFYHQSSFPRMAESYVERYALFEGVPEASVEEWKNVYLEILRKATLKMCNRRLVLKNPVNTGRIKRLLEMFPDAKFVHIYRNPYDVFLSTLHLFKKVLPAVQLQAVSETELEANVLLIYERIMRGFLAQRVLVPPGNLVEIRFEDLEKRPLDELRRLYEALSLPGFEAAEPAFRAYIASQESYQKNRFTLTGDVVETVNRHWRFALESWDYPVLEGSGAACEAT